MVEAASTPPRWTFWFKIILTIAALIAIFTIDGSRDPERSPLQRDFELWLTLFEAKLKAPDSASMPIVTVRAASDSPGDRFVYAVSLSDESSKDRILRLLMLIREGNIFSIHPAALSSQVAITVSVEDGAKHFNTALDPTSIEKNIQAGLLVKLIQTFATMPSSSRQDRSDQVAAAQNAQVTEESIKTEPIGALPSIDPSPTPTLEPEL